MEIDYGDLEMVMAVDPAWDASFYLDGDTGAVIFIDEESRLRARQYPALADIPDGEPESLRAAWCLLWESEVVGNMGDEAEEATVTAHMERLIRIPSFDTRDEYRDMEDFSYQVGNPAVAEQLKKALGGRGSYRRFKNVLNRYAAEWDEWHAFQAERRRARIDEWLRDTGVLPEGKEAGWE